MMGFETKLKEALNKAPFRSVEKDILRCVLGECQQEMRALTSERGHNIVKKIIKSNDECLAHLSQDDERFTRLNKENETLNTLLPQYWSADQVEEFIIKEGLNFSSVKSEGQAMGMAMQKLKQQGAPVEGDIVKSVVAKMRKNNEE